MKRALIAGGALGLVAGGVAWQVARSRPNETSAVPTALVVKEKFIRRIPAEGNLKAVNAMPITSPPPRGGFPRPMKIAWMAPDGSKVAAGEVVLRFDPTELEQALQDGDADLKAVGAKITREHLLAGSAEANRAASANIAEMELEKTRKFQQKDEQIFSRHQIVESGIDERLSQAKRDHAREAVAIEKTLSHHKLAIFQVERKKAEQSRQQARAGLEGLEIKAPHAGILVFQRGMDGKVLKAGDQVFPGQPVAEIPNLSELEAQVFVLEVDAAGLKPGVTATVTIESRPDLEYKAVVKQMDDLAQPRHGNVPVQYFGLTLSLERTDEKLMKPGQRVRATLILDKDEAVVVPRQAILEKDGRNVVYRLEDGRFNPVEVTLGSGTPGRVVVEKGLSAGDRVALRDPTRLLERAKGDTAGPAAGEGGAAP